MTDLEYIIAFRDNNQRAISRFYDEHRNDFLHDLGRYYCISDSDLLAEIFQESVVRLWKNIINKRLTETNLTTTLSGYLFCIGKLVAMEIFRREGIRLKSNLDETEMLKLNPAADILFGSESQQEIAVRKAVYAMGEPCAPLLLSFYWDKLTWESIALQLHYKDANSAKSQKYKCIQKLKAKFL